MQIQMAVEQNRKAPRCTHCCPQIYWHISDKQL